MGEYLDLLVQVSDAYAFENFEMIEKLLKQKDISYVQQIEIGELLAY